MNKYIFLYRKKDSGDRDICAYIEPRLRFECGHYFGGLILHGACYWHSEYLPYDEIETVLTREEYQRLLDYAEAIDKLGYGIKEGDERYLRGIALGDSIKDIFEKLRGGEAREFFEEIQESEKEWLSENENLSEKDIEEIWGCYSLDYRDRSIIGNIWGRHRRRRLR